MRLATLALLPTVLCGCVTDNGVGFVGSVNAWSNAFAAQDNLEIDLMKDFVRKSSELEFISNETYSCGNPESRFNLEAERNYADIETRAPRDKEKPRGYDAVKKAREDIRKKNTILTAIAGYGFTISEIAKGYARSQAVIDAVKSEVDQLKKGGGLEPSSTILTGVSAVLDIAYGITVITQGSEILASAREMKKPLEEAALKIKTTYFLGGMSRPEAIAFSYWNACAVERLNFMRDYYPSQFRPKLKDIYDSKNKHFRFQGMTQTSVLDFAREYRGYMLEREAFIARRPNYVDLIDAIVKANADIISAPDADSAEAMLKVLVALTQRVQPAAVTLAQR